MQLRGVLIKDADEEVFRGAVNMYMLPWGETFIMELVQSVFPDLDTTIKHAGQLGEVLW